MGKIKDIEYTDLLVVGAGIAGLGAAIEAFPKQKVTLLYKDHLDNTTALAQGGIAAAIGKDDSAQQHFKDTLYAGAGLCNPLMVSILVKEGITAVEDLLKKGVRFDCKDGKPALTREGAHSQNRILHLGDSTGKEIRRALESIIEKSPVMIKQNTLILKLIVKNNRCQGAVVYDRTRQHQYIICAKNTILATGGYVQIYKNNTNPSGISGDGIALAKKAGAKIQDMEFVQFHPTTLYGSSLNSSLFLISEAVRGEGAVLLNINKERFMPDYHPLAELAPRDIVTRAIVEEMHKTNTPFVYLDARSIRLNLEERFPSITKECRRLKINISRELIPVAPAAHYANGGVTTDAFGQSSIRHLYACGECAATEVHGANRLASNSLLEGLVFGKRAAIHSLKNEHKLDVPVEQKELNFIYEINAPIRRHIQETTWQNAGIIRNKQNLLIAWRKLNDIERKTLDLSTDHLLDCALMTVQTALRRKESRGCHFRTDYPNTSKLFWKRHLLV